MRQTNASTLSLATWGMVIATSWPACQNTPHLPQVTKTIHAHETPWRIQFTTIQTENARNKYSYYK